MRIITEKQNGGEDLKLSKRTLWFVGIYVASVVVFAIASGTLSLLVPR